MYKKAIIFGNAPTIYSLVPDEKNHYTQYERKGAAVTVDTILKNAIDITSSQIEVSSKTVKLRRSNFPKSRLYIKPDHNQGIVVRHYQRYSEQFPIFRSREVRNAAPKTAQTEPRYGQFPQNENDIKVAATYYNDHDDNGAKDTNGEYNESYIFDKLLMDIETKCPNLKHVVVGINGVSVKELQAQTTYIHTNFKTLNFDLILDCDWLREQCNISISKNLSWERTIQELLFRFQTEETIKKLFKLDDNDSPIKFIFITFGMEGGIILDRKKLYDLIEHGTTVTDTPDCSQNTDSDDQNESGATTSPTVNTLPTTHPATTPPRFAPDGLVLDLHQIEGFYRSQTKEQEIGNMPTLIAAITYGRLKNEDITDSFRKGLTAARFSTLYGLTSDEESYSTCKEGEPSQPYFAMGEIIRDGKVDQSTWQDIRTLSVDEKNEVRLRELRTKDCFNSASTSLKAMVKKTILLLKQNQNEPFFREDETYFTFLPQTNEQECKDLSKLLLEKGDKAFLEEQIPVAKYGDLTLFSRKDIEAFREFASILEAHEKLEYKIPLNIGVFSEPGAGKNFAIKAVLKHLKSKLLDTSLPARDMSQFVNEDDLVRSFKLITESGAQGKVPVVFWDEYDSNRGTQSFGWLQTLLEPMQSRNHASGAIGRAVFIFAGSRFKRREDIISCEKLNNLQLLSRTLIRDCEFNELGKSKLSHYFRQSLQTNQTDKYIMQEDIKIKFVDFVSNKGLDFKRRLHYTFEISGVNKFKPSDCSDVNPPGNNQVESVDFSFLFKRAQIARLVFSKTAKQCYADYAADPNKSVLNISDSAAGALLNPEVEFVHGASSCEAICNLMQHGSATMILASSFPSAALLLNHVRNPDEFESTYRGWPN